MIKRLLLTIFLLSLPFLAFGASISTLTDNFNDNSIDEAKWTATSGVAETNNELEITTTTGGGTFKISSVNRYDLTGSQATIKLVDAGDQSLVSPIFRFLIQDVVDYAGWRIKNGNIMVRDMSSTDIGSTTYVAATYKYLKIRESSGDIYFDYSADGSSWINFTSFANGVMNVTNIKTEIYLNSTAEASTTTAKVDDFNILPSATRRVILIQ